MAYSVSFDWKQHHLVSRDATVYKSGDVVAVVSGGCTTIPESDLEERPVIPGYTAKFPSHRQVAKKSKPGK
ncbi:hypothetical protein Q9966_013047 [Columba livia]|nr:hypothetical protein Q9966_013047 [Columba livia]